jgi:hypothetical protein
VVDVYGVEEGWFEAKDMWEGGWKSFVARMRGKGRVVRWFIGEAIVRPEGTAREPDWRC